MTVATPCTGRVVDDGAARSPPGRRRLYGNSSRSIPPAAPPREPRHAHRGVPVPVPRSRPRRPRRAAAALLAAVAATAIAAGCGSDDGSSGGRPEIVVTTTVLGAVVQDLVGDAADVEVLMPERRRPARLPALRARRGRARARRTWWCENGLDLEEGLEDAISHRPRRRRAGLHGHRPRDAARVRRGRARRGGAEHGPEDPHIWMDPIAMRDVVAALAPVLTDDLGLDLARARRRPRRAARRRSTPRSARTLSTIPAARRKLVTGHESMGYFADRYDFELIGALIPSLSSQARSSASNLAALRERSSARTSRRSSTRPARRRASPRRSATRPAPAWWRSPRTTCPTTAHTSPSCAMWPPRWSDGLTKGS